MTLTSPIHFDCTCTVMHHTSLLVPLLKLVVRFHTTLPGSFDLADWNLDFDARRTTKQSPTTLHRRPDRGRCSRPLKARSRPSPPAAPCKDRYVQESGSVSESSELRIQVRPRAPPAYIIRDGHLMFHRKYQGRRPFTFVDTGLYEGGRHDWYGVHTDRDLIWANRLDLVLRRHNIQRKAPPACSLWQSGAGRT